ncbi:hypothetical protein B0T22DRAFT_278694 [Podospora appendiculata]|uniref:Uncharacterized protein n=1 Tax=Podospora appendiculata TaxID=314037 RepID=A0AAE0X085_9PEZI|nr:hypothetical protein B0T22DRAFT_278694 [Podospora appendiculata]
MATCKACNEPLLLTLDPEDDNDHQHQKQPTVIPDDLHLPCNCHFHWQCLLDQAAEVALSLRCPSCNAYLPSNAPGHAVTNPFRPSSQATPILTRYTNEGGVEDALDILPALTEEAFIASHPEARPARAMHTMAAEGDVTGIVELLSSVSADDDVDLSAEQLLSWTDPLEGGRSALHIAIEAQREEVFWLLLWLGSGLKTEMFPANVVQTAQAMGLRGRREVVPREQDVRFVVDERGRSPMDVCWEVGPPWSHYAESGLFH